MTASPGREVDANLLRGAAQGCAQTRSNAQDAGREDLGDLVEALGRGHEVWAEGVRHVTPLSRFSRSILHTYWPRVGTVGRMVLNGVKWTRHRNRIAVSTPTPSATGSGKLAF
jgi:hypothetical protein